MRYARWSRRPHVWFRIGTYRANLGNKIFRTGSGPDFLMKVIKLSGISVMFQINQAKVVLGLLDTSTIKELFIVHRYWCSHVYIRRYLEKAY